MCNCSVSGGDIGEPQKTRNLFNFEELQKCFEAVRHGSLFANVTMRIRQIISNLTFHPNPEPFGEGHGEKVSKGFN
jgi:hypothetical protein